MLPQDLPSDLPSFLERFGTDEQCRDYLFRARRPDGFRCAGCGHDRAWAHKARLIDECAACGKQHSLLAGTIFEQTKTGLARWFLAIYLVTASKGGIAAMELKRQMGFGSYQTAWTWLHKIRKAMVAPGRQPLAARVEADETYVGGARPGHQRRPPAPLLGDPVDDRVGEGQDPRPRPEVGRQRQRHPHGRPLGGRALVGP